MIDFARISLGASAGALCPKCRPTAEAQQPRPLAQIESELTRVAVGWDSGPGPNVAFSGFEPFAHPELVAVIAAARAAGCERIRLRTDAGALASPANARGVIRAGVTLIEVVIFGDEETHDQVLHRSGAHALAMSGCRSFLAAAHEDGVNAVLTGLIPVCRHNAGTIAHAVAALTAAGAVAVEIDATGAPSGAWVHIESALETAAMAGAAAFVTGGAESPKPLWSAAPWHESRSDES